MISGCCGSQRGRGGGGVIAVRFQGSTSSDTTGGDHLAGAEAAVSDTVAAGAAAGRAATGDSGGKPEAGMMRGGVTGALTRAALGHGSAINPCCASAALPTSRQATRARTVDGCPTALGL